MRPILMTLILLTTLSHISAQVDKLKQLQREKDKVDIFTPEERANLQLWFFEQTQKMGLSEKANDEYNRIFYSYIYDMSRLDDKDRGLTDEEIRTQFELLIDKMNAEMKNLLSTEQYIQHLENFGEIVRRSYEKINWN